MQVNKTIEKQNNENGAFNIERAKNVFNLCDSDIIEINTLIDKLNEHLLYYAGFKSFTAVCVDALQVARALLDGNKKTFKKYKLKYTTHTAEKMRGLLSLSTYKKTSDICKYLSACAVASGGICAKCYAERSISLYRASLEPTLIYNTLLLKYTDISAEQVPYINEKYFRFEAFSDLQSAQHFKNLITICKKNNKTLFALWTKAGAKIHAFMQAQNIEKLPNNLIIILSEFYINKCSYDVTALKQLQNILNTRNALKYFIVYDNENARINSGFYQCKNKCINCLKCYKKAREPLYIAERLR